MHDLLHRSPRHDVVARRRRMQRRLASRRFARLGVVLAAVWLAAVMVRPERSAVTATAAAPAAVSAPPAWRPAGAILRRGSVRAATELPFMAARDTAARASLSRWHRIYSFSRTHRIKPDLARRIYDAAVTAGIEPDLGFRLVRVESEFRPDAVSSAGAIGLTQLMLGTAQYFEPAVTRASLQDPDVNLRIGFRYLRALIREYKGDLKLALLVYNRGPVAVQAAISMGVSPTNGYEHVMLRGYRGRGTLD